MTGFRTSMRWIRHPGAALDAFVDDELDDADAAKVADHLEHCPLCRRRLGLTVHVRRSLRAMAERLGA